MKWMMSGSMAVVLFTLAAGAGSAQEVRDGATVVGKATEIYDIGDWHPDLAAFFTLRRDDGTYKGVVVPKKKLNEILPLSELRWNRMVSMIVSATEVRLVNLGTWPNNTDVYIIGSMTDLYRP